jgi:hypothetical protein
MEGWLGALIAVSGTVGGFLAPIIQEKLRTGKLKQRLELMELIDVKLDKHKEDVARRLDVMENKMATQSSIDQLIQLLKND